MLVCKAEQFDAAFTITAKNRLPSALVCKETFLQHNPDCDFIIFLADSLEQASDINIIRSAEPIISSADLRRYTNKLEEMAYKYNIVEFCTAIKPLCIKYLLDAGYKHIMYFDPDIKFYNSMRAVTDILHNGVECVLTPHITQPMPQDSHKQTDKDILSTGIYNLGFGAWSGNPKVRSFLDWWFSHLVDEAYCNLPKHEFTDQYWMNFAPAFLETYILRNAPGYNVAYWNLHEREITQGHSGRWYVNGVPLIFYHFSGLEYLNPQGISKYQDRYNLENKPELQNLFCDYVDDLRKKNAFGLMKAHYRYDTQNRKDYQNVFQKICNPWLFDKARLPKDPPDKFGINIIGYFPHASGVAQQARNFVRKLYPSGIPYALHPICGPKVNIRREEEAEYSTYYAVMPGYDTNLFFVNLDQIGHVYKDKSLIFKNRRNLLMPSWEIEDSMPYQENFKFVDEIVTYGTFSEGIFRKFAPAGMPVHRLPLPIFIPSKQEYNPDIQLCKQILNLQANDFIVYYAFDYGSSYERKNPEGNLKAFAQAFRGKTNVKLVMKTLNANLYPTESKRLDTLCKTLGIDSQVFILDNPLGRYDLLSLMNICDIFLSLHRSEGYGLNIVEAMSLGKPVVATGYGGNTDFMTPYNSASVSFTKVPVENTLFKHYDNGGTWAEPNIDQAASHMLELYTHSDKRRQLGEDALKSMYLQSNTIQFNEALYNLLEK